MGHGVKDCQEVVQEVKELLETELPYSLALKAEFNFFIKVSMRLGAKIKNSST